MTVTIRYGDCRAILPTLADQSVHCCVTSPPYFGLRDYGHAGQIGLESTPDEYVAQMVAVFREVRRVLRDDATLWLNLGDSYASGGRGGGADGSKQTTNVGAVLGSKKASDGYKAKDLLGIPWRVAFALQADGWYLRQDIIWSKPNPMPESVTDRCTKAHEYIFLMSKSARYSYDAKAIQEPFVYDGDVRMKTAYAVETGKSVGSEYRAPVKQDGRNKRSVWEVSTQGFSEAHFATFPPDLIEPCIKAGCPEGGTVLDPFAGAGTTGLVADRWRRHAMLIELNPDYATMIEQRITDDAGLFAEIEIGGAA